MTNKKLTNRQAIGVLDGLWSNPLFGETHRQAFEIGIKAIKALEQEPCEDAISRQAAIDALWKALYDYEDKTKKQFQESKELDGGDWIQHRIFVQNMNDIDRQTILELPSAQPKTGHWIPVSEKLPDKEGYYLCSVRYMYPPYNFFEPEKVKYMDDVTIQKFDGEFNIEVKAWMPLLEPYEAESEDK